MIGRRIHLGLAVALVLLAPAVPAEAQSCERFAVDGVLPGLSARAVREVVGERPERRFDGDGVAGVARIDEFLREGARLDVYYDDDGRVVGALLEGLGDGLDPAQMARELLERLGPPRLGRVDPDAGLSENAVVWVDRECELILVAQRQPREWWDQAPPATLLHVRTVAQTWAENAELASLLERTANGSAVTAIVQEESPQGEDLPRTAEGGASAVPGSGAPFVAGSGGVTVPERIPEFYVEPDYPDLARRMSVEGRVVLEVVVLRDGSVEDVRVLETSGTRYGFEQAAIDAAKKWRYRPATLGGSPVDAITTAVVEFRR